MEEEAVLAVVIKQSHIKVWSLIVKDGIARDFDAVKVLIFAIVEVQVGAVSYAMAMCFASRYFQGCCSS